MSQKQVVTRPGGTIVRTTSADAITATGQDVIVIPAGKEGEPIAVVSDYTASATVGNRVLVATIRVSAAGNIVWMGTSSANVAAGQVCGYDISFGQVGTPSTTVRRNLAETGNVNVMVREFCPIKRMAAGWVLNIDDIANIDVADVLTHKTVITRYEA